MKKFLRRLARPFSLQVLAAGMLAALVVHRDYFFPLAVLLGAHLLVESVAFFTDSLIKRRKGPEAVKDNLIELYVDDVVYGRLQEMAAITGLSVSEFCCCVLGTLDVGELCASYVELHEEVDHGE